MIVIFYIFLLMLVQYGKEVTDGPRYRLLELSDTLVANAIEKGEKLSLKGTNSDDAILCTGEKTFRVREVHTSNLMLVVDNKGRVMETTQNYLELDNIPPRLDRLRKSLEACPYQEDDEEGVIDNCLSESLEVERIFASIQGSDKEIFKELERCDAMMIDGRYRVISADIQCRFFKTLFAVMAIEGLKTTDTIDISSLNELLSREPLEERISNHLIRVYGITKDSMWNLNESKMCRFFARELFKARSVWHKNELVNSWCQLTGDTIPNVEMLNGMAIFQAIGDDSLVTYFPCEDLPMEPIARFSKLFEVCNRWDFDMMTHFVEDSAMALGVSTLDLIVKHCRISTMTDKSIVTPLFSS